MAPPTSELQSRRTQGNLSIGPMQIDSTTRRARIVPGTEKIPSISQNWERADSTIHGGKDLGVTAEYEPTVCLNYKCRKSSHTLKSLI